jgi:predicted amidophosphoribosyltransferase
LVRGIRRIRATPEQAALGAADRLSNLAGAFRIDRALTGRRVCIVNDVVTTGATANALACALLDAGAAAVTAAAVARTLE